MGPTLIKCPTCRREIEWSSSEFRPFCSERCRLIDLGAWLTEKHAIPGDAVETGNEKPDDGAPENRHGGSH